MNIHCECEHRGQFNRLENKIDSLVQGMSELNRKVAILMALDDQLKTDVSALVDAVNVAVSGETSILAIVQDLAAKSANAGSVPDADVQAALTRIEGLTSQLSAATASAVASAQAADPTFTPPAPAPAA